MRILLFFILIALSVSCRKQDKSVASRSFRMGFQSSAPRIDLDLAIRSLNIWTTRADAAIISEEVPWDSLYAGVSPEQYVQHNYKGLSDFYRSKQFKLWLYIDPQNGLDRTSDSRALSAMGKSIADPDVQSLYRRFVVVADSILQPEHIGLALETNLIRDAASAAVYNGVKKAVNDVAADLSARKSQAKKSISIQVEQAWGKFIGGTYSGIEKDFSDFPFIEELGLSSYPYFSFSKPADLPNDYYARPLNGRKIPVFVSEGGWTSQSMSGFTGSLIPSSPAQQRDYIRKQGELLQNVNAIGVFQLTFTDIDVAALPPTVPSSIQYFAFLGLVDKDLQARPALGAWDSLYMKPLR